MKRTAAFILICIMALTLFSGCQNAADDGVFTVGFDAAFPPYGYQDTDGTYVGFDLDLAAEVAKRNDWELKLQPIDWNAKDSELDSGAIDCIWNGFTINGREDDYTWTEAYVDNTQVFVVKADSGINTVADLAGKTVTAQADSSALSALEDEDNKDMLASFKDGKVLPCAQYNAAFMELEAGAVDAIAMDVGVAEFQIAGRESEFKILDELLMTEQYGVGFKLGNTALRDKVQATMKEMVADGTFKTISEKWFDGRDVCILQP